MTPVETRLTERTVEDIITDLMYEVRWFGVVIYRRYYHNEIVELKARTSGFDVTNNE